MISDFKNNSLKMISNFHSCGGNKIILNGRFWHLGLSIQTFRRSKSVSLACDLQVKLQMVLKEGFDFWRGSLLWSLILFWGSKQISFILVGATQLNWRQQDREPRWLKTIFHFHLLSLSSPLFHSAEPQEPWSLTLKSILSFFFFFWW